MFITKLYVSGIGSIVDISVLSICVHVSMAVDLIYGLLGPWLIVPAVPALGSQLQMFPVTKIKCIA